MDTIKLEREELLKRLHALPFCMYLTALPSEGCLEVNVVSSKGTAYSWESFDEFAFYAYCLEGISKDKIMIIKERIASESLYVDDLNGTQLEELIPPENKSEELSDIFVDFLELPDENLESAYCYRDIETGVVYVSDTEEGLSEVLNDKYTVDTTWEEYSDEQLKEFLDEYESAECEIPFSYFD